jgi:hypothetical protein
VSTGDDLCSSFVLQKSSPHLAENVTQWQCFMGEFGRVRMHPGERGKGKRRAQWRKGSHKP